MPLNQFGHRTQVSEGPEHIHRAAVEHLGDPQKLVGVVQLTCATVEALPLIPGVPTQVTGGTMVTFPDPSVATVFLELIHTNVIPMLMEAIRQGQSSTMDLGPEAGPMVTMAKAKKENWN